MIALANLYDVNIHLFDLSQKETENEDFQTIITPFDKDQKYQKLDIYINYVNKNHYQAYDRDKFKEDSLKKKQPTEDEADGSYATCGTRAEGAFGAAAENRSISRRLGRRR